MTEKQTKLPPRPNLRLTLSRELVRAGAINEVLKPLTSLLEDAVRAHANKSRFELNFEGFDEGLQPYEDAELRAFFARLDERFPYWFFFLSQEDDSIALAASLLTDTVEVAPGIARIDPDSMQQFFSRQLAGLEQLYGMLELPETDLRRLLGSIEHYFKSRASEPPEEPRLH